MASNSTAGGMGESDAVSKPNYYWRDYHGNIPYDAVPGGHDQSDETTYIGQAFIKSCGLIPCTIIPGVKQVTVPSGSTTPVDDFIKILCSPNKDRFQWIAIKSDDMHVKAIDKHLVVGGMEYNSVLHIGRAADNNNIIIGKISTDKPGRAILTYTTKNNEKSVDSCQVLVYNKS